MMSHEKSPQERIQFQRRLLCAALVGQLVALPFFGIVFVQQYFWMSEGMPEQELFWLKPLLGLMVGLTVLSGAAAMKMLLARQEWERELADDVDRTDSVWHGRLGQLGAFCAIFLPLLSLLVAEAKPGWYFGALILTIPLYATLPLAISLHR